MHLRMFVIHKWFSFYRLYIFISLAFIFNIKNGESTMRIGNLDIEVIQGIFPVSTTEFKKIDNKTWIFQIKSFKIYAIIEIVRN